MMPIALHPGPERTILDELLGVVRRRKLVIALTTLAMILGTYLVLILLPEKYEATTQLQVMLGRENTEVSAAAQRGNVYAPGVQREEINSVIQLLKSRDLVEGAVDRLGMTAFRFDPPPPETLFQTIKHELRAAKKRVVEVADDVLIRIGLKKELTEHEKVVQMLAGSLEVAREAESNVIRVALRLPDRGVATQTLAAVTGLFFDRYAALRTTATVLPVLERQVEADGAELVRLQDDRQTVLAAFAISSVERQRSELLQQLHKVLYDSDGRRTELDAAAARLAVLNERVAALPVDERDRQTSAPNPSYRALKERLVDLRMKRGALAPRYYLGTSNPLTEQIDAEIGALQAALSRESERQLVESTSQANPIRVSLQGQVEQTGVQIAGLQASLRQDQVNADRIRGELSRLTQGEAKLQLVDLRLEAAQKRFMADAARRDAMRVDEMLDRSRVTNVALLVGAAATPEPVAPQKLRIMGFGAMGGLVLGMLLGLLLEWGDDTLHGRAEFARATGLPLLGEFQLGGGSLAASEARLDHADLLARQGPSRVLRG